MIKTRSKKYVKRNVLMGGFIVKQIRKGHVIVTGKGVNISASSSRRAKIAAKGMVNYSRNIMRHKNYAYSEMKSAISLGSKELSELESKYKNVTIASS